MKVASLGIIFFLMCTISLIGQSKFTESGLEEILLGDYNPQDFYDDLSKTPKDLIVTNLNQEMSSDYLKSYLLDMMAFKTRNSGSDTIGNNGIGAARDYALQKFIEFSEEEGSHIIPSFFEFERTICEVTRHKNICAIQPGVGDDPSIIVIEAHLDSRCSSVCDIECDAHGMEDNASGSALVLELARIMGKNTYEHTIVYMLTIGEEQGLVGADAFSEYCVDTGIEVKAVFNNDIVGGIICGETSSGPSCPGEGHVDSLQVRLFSHGAESRQLSRWIKEQYKEELQGLVQVPMLLSIMSLEDRQGRGGDHIPFREDGFLAMRFTSANEHGNANAADPDYHDRQHTSDDILGMDTNLDGELDSFFVDFNYLGRNAVINGTSASLAANGPDQVTFDGFIDGDSLLIEINDDNNIGSYKVYSRSSTSQDLDTSYVVSNGNSTRIVKNPGSNFAQFISVSSMDDEGIESILSLENFINTVLSDGVAIQIEQPKEKLLTLLQNRPNPFDEATSIGYVVHHRIPSSNNLEVVIRDLNGVEIHRMEGPKNEGYNEVVYNHGFNKSGTFIYTVEIDKRPIASKTMIFAY